MPFRCVVNLIELDLIASGGVSRIASEVVKLLVDEADSSLRPIVLAGSSRALEIFDWLEQRVMVVPVFTSIDARHAVTQLKPDLIISPLFGMWPFSRIPVPQVIQVPDTLVFDHPEYFTDRERRGRVRRYADLSRAQRVVTISAFSKRQLIRHLSLPSEQVTVIGLASGHAEPDFSVAQLLPPRYVLYPARPWQHKRHPFLLQIMEYVWKQQPNLALVLPGSWSPAAIRSLTSEWGNNNLANRPLLFPGFLTDGQLRVAYRNAEALLFVSAYEGFGMPVVEAMAEGCPVICAPVTALPEVVGDAALVVDSDDPEAWARALLDQLPLERDIRIERGRAQAGQSSWATFREDWKVLLAQSGVPFNAGITPHVPEEWGVLLRELQAIQSRLHMNWSGDRDALAAAPQLVLHPIPAKRAWDIHTHLLDLASPFPRKSS